MADQFKDLIKEAVREVLEEKIQHGDVRTERLLQAQSAAEYIGVSKSEIYGMLKAGEIPVIQHGRCVLVDKNDLDEWIKANKKQGYGKNQTAA